MRELLGRTVSHLRCLYFDLRHGVDTRGTVPPAQLGINAEAEKQAIPYVATQPKLLHRLFGELPLNSRAYTLTDFGSGKGRVLLVASEYPFAKIIGVEISQALNQIAQHNIKNYRGPRPRCQEISAICANALDREIDDREDAVFLFYNPFREPVMAPLLAKIERSLANHPRDVFLIYISPFLAHLVDRTGMFERFSETPWSLTWRSRDPGSRP